MIPFSIWVMGGAREEERKFESRNLDKIQAFSGLAPAKLKIFPKNFKVRLCVHRGIV